MKVKFLPTACSKSVVKDFATLNSLHRTPMRVIQVSSVYLKEIPSTKNLARIQSHDFRIPLLHPQRADPAER